MVDSSARAHGRPSGAHCKTCNHTHSNIRSPHTVRCRRRVNTLPSSFQQHASSAKHICIASMPPLVTLNAIFTTMTLRMPPLRQVNTPHSELFFLLFWVSTFFTQSTDYAFAKARQLPRSADEHRCTQHTSRFACPRPSQMQAHWCSVGKHLCNSTTAHSSC